MDEKKRRCWKRSIALLGVGIALIGHLIANHERFGLVHNTVFYKLERAKKGFAKLIRPKGELNAADIGFREIRAHFDKEDNRENIESLEYLGWERDLARSPLDSSSAVNLRFRIIYSDGPSVDVSLRNFREQVEEQFLDPVLYAFSDLIQFVGLVVAILGIVLFD